MPKVKILKELRYNGNGSDLIEMLQSADKITEHCENIKQHGEHTSPKVLSEYNKNPLDNDGNMQPKGVPDIQVMKQQSDVSKNAAIDKKYTYMDAYVDFIKTLDFKGYTEIKEPKEKKVNSKKPRI